MTFFFRVRTRIQLLVTKQNQIIGVEVLDQDQIRTHKITTLDASIENDKKKLKDLIQSFVLNRWELAEEQPL